MSKLRPTLGIGKKGDAWTRTITERDALSDELEKIVALRPQIEKVAQERDELRAENDRLTLAASEAQSQAESWRLGLGQANDKLLELQIAASESARTLQVEIVALRGALGGLLDLIDEGRLVRNTINDHHMPSYLAESVQLVKTLAHAKELLAALPQDAAHDGGEGSKKP